ncbi:hypothetical protein DY000_02032806 [Brassica cretica]|uniref:Reverse transcriptase zinc-binding domain-containing protein n=1 Tax=Brassica cretica TaxID=69181 RepID=A0ABQ7DKD9_BRACR|nr:hypothetical protein DY000_02032806 [Brassica cretica]
MVMRRTVLWRSGPDAYKCEFSSFQTWEQIRPHREKQDWSKVVWLAQGVPRFAFITWLAIRDRLATGVRMRQWGVVQGFVGDLLGVSADPDWEMTLSRLERNDMRHTGKLKLVGQLIALIEKTVKNRIMSTRYFEKPKLLGLMQRWFREH